MLFSWKWISFLNTSFKKYMPIRSEGSLSFYCKSFYWYALEELAIIEYFFCIQSI
jgi:hypothetical protein